MANYYASARSNYFKVKDLAEFSKAMIPFDVEISEEDQGVCLLCSGEGGWSWYDPDIEEDHDPVDLIAPHLQDNEVCILMETGAEKLRYLIGYAIAFNNQKEMVDVSLENIYEQARKKFGADASITDASY
jgi:hypothetical protein